MNEIPPGLPVSNLEKFSSEPGKIQSRQGLRLPGREFIPVTQARIHFSTFKSLPAESGRASSSYPDQAEQTKQKADEECATLVLADLAATTGAWADGVVA